MKGRFWLIGLATAVGVGFTVVSHAAELTSATVEAKPLPQQRLFDGVIEAVHHSTVSAQTIGRIVEINYDVEDFVPKDAVILRISDKEQRARVSSVRATWHEKVRLTQTSPRKPVSTLATLRH